MRILKLVLFFEDLGIVAVINILKLLVAVKKLNI